MKVFPGGKGKKAPYEDTHIRVPIPLKESIMREIGLWKLRQGYNDPEYKLSGVYTTCLQLVNQFISESGQAEKLSQRNNTNLVRFRSWLKERIDEIIRDDGDVIYGYEKTFELLLTDDFLSDISRDKGKFVFIIGRMQDGRWLVELRPSAGWDFPPIMLWYEKESDARKVFDFLSKILREASTSASQKQLAAESV